MFRRLSIRDKLALALWGAALLAFAVATAALALFGRLTLESRARQIMEPYAQLVSVGAEAAVAFEDPGRAREILDTLRANPQIRAAQLVLADGRLLAAYSRRSDAPFRPRPPRPDGVYLNHNAAELTQSLRDGAHLYLVMSLDQLNRETRNVLLLFAAGVAVLLAVITLGLLAALRRIIVRPVSTLAETVERVRTRADYHQRVPASGTDEVARLGRSFNAMLGAIQDRENDLRRLTLFQRTLLDSAAHGIISAAPDGVVSSFNPAAERLLGYSADELVGKQTPACWHDPEEVARRALQLSEELGETIPPGFDVFVARPRRDLPEENEWTFIRKDGTRVPVLLSVTALRSENGEITGFVGLTNDLSERKRAEEQRLSHLRFFERMDRVNRAILGTNDLEQMMSDVLDIVLSIFDCDRAFLMYPCDPEAASWRVPMERDRPDYPAVFARGLEMVMDEEVAAILRILLDADGPIQFGPGSGDPLPADLSRRFGFRSFMATALHAQVGKPWQFGIHQCSYPRVWTREEVRLLLEIGRRLADALTTLSTHRDLLESEARYRSIVDTAIEGILVVGPDGTTTFVNARMAEMLDYSRSEMCGRPATDFLFEEDAPDNRKKMEDRRQGLSENYERRFRRKDGETVWTLASAAPIFDDERHFQGSFAMVTDITGRKRDEQEIRRLNAELGQKIVQLQEAQEDLVRKEKLSILGQLSGSVGHELRNPLGVMSNAVYFLKMVLAEADETVREYLGIIESEIGNSQRIIGDLLDFARTKAPQRQAVAAQELVRQSLERCGIPENVKVEVDIAQSLPRVSIDPLQMGQVLANFISNAVQAMPDGGALRIAARRGAGPKDRGSEELPTPDPPIPVTEEDFVEIAVSDTGEGIAPENMKKLFQPLFTTKPKGIGLGLVVCRNLVEANGGRIVVSSEFGKGTTFTVVLPAKRSET